MSHKIFVQVDCPYCRNSTGIFLKMREYAASKSVRCEDYRCNREFNIRYHVKPVADVVATPLDQAPPVTLTGGGSTAAVADPDDRHGLGTFATYPSGMSFKPHGTYDQMRVEEYRKLISEHYEPSNKFVGKYGPILADEDPSCRFRILETPAEVVEMMRRIEAGKSGSDDDDLTIHDSGPVRGALELPVRAYLESLARGRRGNAVTYHETGRRIGKSWLSRAVQQTMDRASAEVEKDAAVRAVDDAPVVREVPEDGGTARRPGVRFDATWSPASLIPGAED